MPIKRVPWEKRDRQFKLASVLWPNLADAGTRKEMDEISAREGKVSPSEALRRSKAASRKT
jgi:hypothetical protein